MTSKRLIACLDVDAGRVKKGVRFAGLADCGDPAELAARYEQEGADEIVFLDVSATIEARKTILGTVERTARTLFIPLTVGGGITDVADAVRLLRAGADKIALNSGAVARPSLIADCAERLGAQCVVVSIDVKRRADRWYVTTHGGRRDTAIDALDWARQAVSLGAGELLLTSIDRDGCRTGYDLPLLREVCEAVSVPVVASGGAGNAQHVSEAFAANASAALLAGILHDGTTSPWQIKRQLTRDGFEVRS